MTQIVGQFGAAAGLPALIQASDLSDAASLNGCCDLRRWRTVAQSSLCRRRAEGPWIAAVSAQRVYEAAVSEVVVTS
jgi:hypothetical protein